MISFIRRMFGASSGGRGPTDDFWYTPLAGRSSSGVPVTPLLAMQLTVVYACVKVISESIGTLPLGMFQREPDGDKVKAPENPLHELLHDQANEEHTAAEWREATIARALLRGTAYTEIVPGRRGAVDQLIPLDHVRPIRVLDASNRSQWQFEVKENGEPTKRLLRDEVFILRGLVLADNGIEGLDPIQAEREAIGGAATTQAYGSRFFANDARPPMWVEHPSHFREEADKKRFMDMWQRAHSGANRGKAAVLEHGMKLHYGEVNNESAQFLETRKYHDSDIARIFRVPPHKVGIMDRAMFSNIEHQALEFVIDTLQPWLVRYEQAIRRDLIVNKQRDFAEHNVAGLLRGDLRARYEAYAIGRNWGWLSVNEIRRLENMNSVPEGDTRLQPLNMVEAGEPGEPSGQGQRRAPDPEPQRTNGVATH